MALALRYHIYLNKCRGAYLICVYRGRRLFKRLIPQSQNYFMSINIYMAYRLEANLVSFGFHISVVNTLLQVFNNASLDVNVLTVAESSQYLTQDALYLSLCIYK